MTAGPCVPPAAGILQHCTQPVTNSASRQHQKTHECTLPTVGSTSAGFPTKVCGFCVRASLNQACARRRAHSSCVLLVQGWIHEPPYSTLAPGCLPGNALPHLRERHAVGDTDYRLLIVLRHPILLSQLPRACSSSGRSAWAGTQCQLECWDLYTENCWLLLPPRLPGTDAHCEPHSVGQTHCAASGAGASSP